jgi:hypothetical protein
VINQEFPQKSLDQARKVNLQGPLEPEGSETGALLFQTELTGDALQ